MRTNKYMPVIKTILVLAGMAGIAAPCFGATQVFEGNYPLRPGGRFALENVNGSVEVEGWEREQVEIRAVKTAAERAQDLDQVKIEVESDGSSVAVYTRYREGEGINVAVEYHVHVPYRVMLSTVSTINGDVHVRGVDGNGTLSSVNGNVQLLDSSGRFSARTTNGNLRLELRRLDGGAPMTVATVNGSVTLALPPNAAADLRVVSMNGDFRSELPVRLEGAFRGRSFRAQMGGGGSELRLRTINGTIRVIADRPSV